MTANTTDVENVNEPTHVRRHRAVAAAAVAILSAAALGWLSWSAAPGPTALHAGTPRYVVSITLTSSRVGVADVEVSVDPRDPGAAPTEIRDVWIQAVMPTMGHVTARFPARASDGVADANRYRTAGLPLMMAGPWQLRVSITYAGGTDELSIPIWVSG